MEEMNEVNDFMAKFDNDFEIKWGLAIDPELGKRVKVTILATGFGIEDVDGMHTHLGKKRTQEDADRLAQEEEKAAELQDRRNRYYGKDSNNSQYKRRPHIFLFRPEDLDNEDVILRIDNTPTYKRSKQTIDEIRRQAAGITDSASVDNPSEPVQGTISFA